MQINTGTPLLSPQLAKTGNQPAQPQSAVAAFEPVEFRAAAPAAAQPATAEAAQPPARPLPPGSKIDIRV